jgi:hypothetical protein
VGSKGAEGYGGGTVEAAYCPPVDAHCGRIGEWVLEEDSCDECCERDRVVWVD